ncbi:hypothetical protein GQ53DRAFT_806457 [Thozetella sp. PMI_491]|nr:hypothetical protein GQ53DRAFT_806457 [Thozetella sp. PMI_491]
MAANMAAQNIPASVCLDVAIDHRIRKLFGPVLLPVAHAPVGEHLSILRAAGQRWGRPSAEIDVTTALAGPASTGGIAVVLQQPRDNHPFEQGAQAVIQDCRTLDALQELFSAVSCGTVDLLTDVTVIDLLPYTPERERTKLGVKAMRETFSTSVDAFCAKEPDVVLCAGRIWMPRGEPDCKGDAYKLEGVGVGQRPKCDTVRLRNSAKTMTKIRKVNGFHPSSALSYLSEHSCLRQLLCLVVAETCEVYRDRRIDKPAWDQRWMESLRVTCSQLFARTQVGPLLGDAIGSSADARSGCYKVSPRKSWNDFALLYSEKLEALDATITSISRPPDDTSWTALDLYDSLLGSGLTTQCNDTSLVLRKMHSLEEAGRPLAYDEVNRKALHQAAEETFQLVTKSWDTRGWFGNTGLRKKSPVVQLKLGPKAERAEKYSLLKINYLVYKPNIIQIQFLL